MIVGKCIRTSTAAAWDGMTAGAAGTELATADVLAHWFRCILLWELMTDCMFPKESPEMLCAHISPVTEANDGGSNLVELMVKSSWLEVPACFSSTTR